MTRPLAQPSDDERLAAMQQWVAEGAARPDIVTARRGRVPVAQTRAEADAIRRSIDEHAMQTGQTPEEVEASLHHPGDPANAAMLDELTRRNQEALALFFEAVDRKQADPRRRTSTPPSGRSPCCR